MSAVLSDSVFFGAAATIGFYALGLWLKRRFRLAILNPILIATACLIGVLRLTGVSYTAYLQGADWISYLLTPATVCLALPLYDRLVLLKAHWRAVCAGLLCGVLTSLLCVLGLCRLLKLSPQLYATFLPKSITTAIGMGVAEELGGIVPVTVACIILTGIAGSIMAEGVFRLCRVRSPLAKGVAIGAASHAIGTAKAAEMGPTEAAMSSLSLAVCGLLTAVLAPLFYSLW